jgi:GT2 family glycosyltransferase
MGGRVPRSLSAFVEATPQRRMRAAWLVPALVPWVARQACQEAGLGRALIDPGGFDPVHYSAAVGQAFRSAGTALFHYLVIGSVSGISPRPDFDPNAYRRRNPDVAAAGYEPFAHYLNFGRHEGRGATAAADAPDDTTLPLADVARMLMRPARRASAASVDVVVPVYGGRQLALQTIDSVLAAEGRTSYELIVVDDASPDPMLRSELRQLAEKGFLTLLTNERNIGFVGTANRGFALHADRDVVLLNSDTRVFDGWLDRLTAALHGASRTGTACPLSNSATILSYPIPLRDNHRLPGMDFAELDRVCAQVGDAPVEVPTAVGFCMAVKRACLDEVGLFDTEQFGRGYGEENDFSLRAAAAGWRHMAATDVFVWHRGGGSFGMEREALIATAQATLERLHPGYEASIGHFIGRDPLAPARAALDAARIRADSRRKRLVLGGISQPAEEGFVDIGLIHDLAPHAGALRFTAPSAGGIPNLPRIDARIETRDLAALLRDLAIDLVTPGEVTVEKDLKRRWERAANEAGVAWSDESKG